NEGETFVDLIALIESELKSLPHPALGSFLADWPESAAQAIPARLPRASAPLPVLRWLPHIAAGAREGGSVLAVAVCRAAPSLAWHQSYGTGEVSPEFL